MDYGEIDTWAKKAQTGDTVAVELLLLSFRPLLLSAADRFRCEGYAFEDALQDMRVAFLEGIKVYDPGHASGFAGFIRGYLGNRPRNAQRKRNRQAMMEEPMGEKKGPEGETLSWIEMLEDTGVDLEGDYVHQELLARLREGMKALTAEQCQIVEGHYVRGVSLKKLAVMMKLSYSTLQRRHVAVLRRLWEGLSVGV